MALIKNAIADQIARDAIVLDLGDLQRQGSYMVQQAKLRAERVVADATAERERIVEGAMEQGRKAGHAKGLEEGRAQGRAEAAAIVMAEHKQKLEELEASWGNALSEFSAHRDLLVQRATEDVLRLAVAIAERVIKRTVAVDPSVVVDQLNAVLAVVVRPTELVLAVHPEDRPLVQQALPGLLSLFTAVRHAEIIDDPSLPRGSCIARTRGESSASGPKSEGDIGGGVIDASITTQLDRIVEALVPARSSDVAESDRTF